MRKFLFGAIFIFVIPLSGNQQSNPQKPHGFVITKPQCKPCQTSDKKELEIRQKMIQIQQQQKNKLKVKGYGT